MGNEKKSKKGVGLGLLFFGNWGGGFRKHGCQQSGSIKIRGISFKQKLYSCNLVNKTNLAHYFS
jgi:hypothetical protein